MISSGTKQCIGKQFIIFFGDIDSDKPRTKCFLTADDFNPRASGQKYVGSNRKGEK